MSITIAEENALIELVRQTAKTEIMPRFRQLQAADIKQKSSRQDLVTEADLNSERAITAGVRQILPQAAIIGEEAVAEDRRILDQIAQAAQAVIIDPIDGTWNYAKGISTFGVILAVTEQGQTVFGLLYDPALDDWILARKGGGTWYCVPGKSPQQLQFAEDNRETGERVAMISPFLFPPDEREAVARNMLVYDRVQTLRCACHEYRAIVTGAFDFSLNLALNPWDHAAGALAVEEAGGTVSLVDGSAYDPTIHDGRMIAACSTRCLQEARDWYGALG